MDQVTITGKEHKALVLRIKELDIEVSRLREALESCQAETRDAARQQGIYLDRCPKCGYSGCCA
jgi:hypothetical protein